MYEKWTCDLAGVCDRHGIVVPVHVFTVGFGSATVLALILSNGKPLGEVKETHGWIRSMVLIILVALMLLYILQHHAPLLS